MGSLRSDRAGATRLSRRQVLAGGLSLAALLAGCGTSTPAPPASPPDAPAGRPVAVAHKYGSTTIAAEPRRVVTVGLSDHDYLLALGVVPVGLTDWYGDQPYGTWPWARAALGPATPALLPRNDDKLDLEKIAALRPDLIIGQYSGMTATEYEAASRIAPTVAQSGGFPDFGMPWQDTTRVIAQAVGRVTRGEELIAGVEQRFAAARDQHPEFAGRSAVVAERFEGFEARSASDPRTRFLTSLGFVLPADIAGLAGASDTAKLSDEQVGLLDRDLLVWNAGFSPELREVLAGNALYQQLAVVRDGRVVFLDDPVLSGALTWSTVLSLPFALDALTPVLAGALDGRP
ncbi:MAG TPA: iron-siderophore ABC transporter substrate-binding protein [Actinophytocola sp.]|nr:iron-siderophore ABC transporter substrate-binding protein [Actinophytocola sp.]